MLGGITKRRTLHRLGATAALTFIMASGGEAEVQSRGADGIHLGVASCAGNNCHGATERSEGSSVAQNEYLIWSFGLRHSSFSHYTGTYEAPSFHCPSSC